MALTMGLSVRDQPLFASEQESPRRPGSPQPAARAAAAGGAAGASIRLEPGRFG